MAPRHPRRRPALSLRRRRVRGDPARRRPAASPTRSPSGSGAASSSCRTTTGGPHVDDQRRGRLLPGRRPRQGRPGRDGRPRAVPRQARGRSAVGRESLADPYLRALDETALALLDRHDSTVLLETILTRATRAARDAARLHLPRRARRARARRPPRQRPVRATARPPDRRSTRASSARSSGPARPLVGRRLRHVRRPRAATSRSGRSARSSACRWRRAATSVGVIGLASGTTRSARSARARSHALTRFAQLASIALDNSRLFDAAQRGALHDPTTGLPNRELLTDRIAPRPRRVRPPTPPSRSR